MKTITFERKPMLETYAEEDESMCVLLGENEIWTTEKKLVNLLRDLVTFRLLLSPAFCSVRETDLCKEHENKK